MSPKEAAARVESAEDEHPLFAALAKAPLSEEPETDEEREAVAAALANPLGFVSGDVVTAELAARRASGAD